MHLNGRMDVVTLADRPDLEPRLWDLTRAWPRFMLNDPISDLYYDNLERWAEHTLIGIVDGEVVARGFSSAFAMGGEDRPELPTSGWDGVVHWSYLDALNGRPPNEVSALEIVIAPEHRGQGMAAVMVQAMVDNVARLGYRRLFAPVRPSEKHLEPTTPMECTLGWAQRCSPCALDRWSSPERSPTGENGPACRSMNPVPSRCPVPSYRSTSISPRITPST
jgi:GNAT superfamily N-acetyltransferase